MEEIDGVPDVLERRVSKWIVKKMVLRKWTVCVILVGSSSE